MVQLIPMTTTAIALRMSTDRGDRIEEHLPVCREVCRRLGLDEPETYIDNDVSASKDRGPKTRYYALIQDVAAGRIKTVIIFNTDRFLRRVRDLEEWLALSEAGRVRLVSATESLDTSTPDGRMYLRIKVSVAQHETEHKSARQRFANDGRAAAGLPTQGGRRAFGYRDGLTLEPAEAAAVARAYADAMDGVSLRSIAARWNAAGLLTPLGNRWRAPGVRLVLLNPRNAGIVVRGGVEVGVPARWPSLVDEDTWRAVSATFAAACVGPRGGNRLHLLPGLALCGVCGARMTTAVRSKAKGGHRLLRCDGQHLARIAEPIERYVVEVVLARLSRLDAVDLLVPPTPDTVPLRARSSSLRAQRRALAADTSLELDFAAGRDRALLAELRRIEAELETADGRGALSRFVGRAPEEVWADLDLDIRRAVIDELMIVTVLPVRPGTRTWRPGSVRLEPR